MNRLALGLMLGISFGVIAVILMVPLSFPDKRTALLGAFLDRFAIGFIVAQTEMPLAWWVRGALVGLLISLPSAVVTKAYVPITLVGILGGAVCGIAAGAWIQH